MSHLTIRLSGADSCPICNAKSKILKTTKRKCYSYQLGEFNLFETISYCPTHKYSALNLKTYLKFKPSINAIIVEDGHQVSIDLIVKIGLLRFKDNYQLREIQSFLKTSPCRIDLSIPTIGRASKQFLIYCKEIHNLHEDIIKRNIGDNGGYVLHFDATTEIFAGKVNYVFRDSLSEHILLSMEAPSEKHLYLFPAIKEIKNKYGNPLMTMSDLKSGSLTAVEDVFKDDACHVFCHYHFLRTFNVDFAKDHAFVKTKLSRKDGPVTTLRDEMKFCTLTKTPSPTSLKTYDEIEKFWMKTKNIQVTYYYALQWILSFKQESSGKGVPFDLPYIDFWERILKAEKLIKKIFKESNSKHRTKISNMINDIKKGIETQFLSAIEASKYRHQWFNRLRIALVFLDKKDDIAPLSKKYSLTKNEASNLVGNIETYVEEIDKEIAKEKCELKIKVLNRFKKQTLKYANNLIVPTFEVVDRDGNKQTIVGPRTNNSLEAFFREGKSNLRRKSGKSSTVKEFSSIGGLLPYYITLKKHKSFSKIMADERVIIGEVTKLIASKKLSKKNIIALPRSTKDAQKLPKKDSELGPVLVKSNGI